MSNIKLIDKIKIQLSTLLMLRKRLHLNGFFNGIKLLFYNSLLIWVDNDRKRKRLYIRKHNLDQSFVTQLAKQIDIIYDSEKRIKCENYKIFVLWWQGEAGMPPIIRATISSIREATEKEVVLITRDNVKQYIDIPEFILKKFDSKKIGPAHFSDYTRVALLEKYGGLWIDSTVLCTSNIPEWIYDKDFFTIRAKEYYTDILDEKYVAKGRWSTQVLGTNMKEFPFFSVIRCLMELYWEKYNYMIDYLLFDDFILYAYNTYPSIKQYFDNVPVSNIDMHALFPMMNNSFDKQKWELLTYKTYMFKLTYKGQYMETKNGNETYYKHIISQFS
jgi:hypothetical protein